MRIASTTVNDPADLDVDARLARLLANPLVASRVDGDGRFA
jgi:4-hydroxybenzoate polyprenyltransferase